jgi:mRNA-degrading endonuclease RelE of RelBE toxin-antitoxin system
VLPLLGLPGLLFWVYFVSPPGTRICLHLIGGTIKYARGGRNAEFQKRAKAVWSDAEREAFIEWIAANPGAGDVIPGANGARKVRLGRAGKGKRGGVRVIYFHLTDDEIVLLVMVYTKAAQASVKPKDIKRG